MTSKLAIVIAICGLGLRTTVAQPTTAQQGVVGQLYCDNFDRPLLGADWVADSLSFSIVGNQIAEDSGTTFQTGQLRWVGGITDTIDQVGKMQLFSTANDTAGLMFRANGAPGPHYEVHLRTGSGTWRWEGYDPAFVDVKGQCLGDLAPSDGDYIGATVEGTGASTTVSVWRWSVDPDFGGAIDITNNWGPPDCILTGAPGPYVDTGLSVGLRSFSGNSTLPELGDNWCGGDILAATAAPQCVIDADCDDGNACNGAEFCDAMGVCQAGAPLACGIGSTCDRLTPAPFVEHFNSATIDATCWAVKTAGSGTAALSGDSFVAFNAPTPTDAGFLHHNLPIDLTRSQTWQFCVRRNTGDSLTDLVALWGIPNGMAPEVAATASLATELRVSAGLVNLGPTPSLRFTYRQTADGALRQWDGEPSNVWAAPGVQADAVDAIREGFNADWYVIGLQLDADMQRLRMFSQHREAADLTDAAQGTKLVSLTDWVTYADIGIGATGESLWLAVGNRDTTALSAMYDLEWIRFESETAVPGWTNARALSTEPYTLRQQLAYGTQFVPIDRDTIAIPAGAAGSWNAGGHRKKHVIRDSDGTYYMFHEGFDAASESAIGVSSSSTPDGPWTPAAGNPIIPRSILPASGAAYDVITAPWAIKDIAEPNALKRWRLFVTGEVRATSTHRLFLLSAPAVTGPWTLEVGTGPDGSILGESLAGDWRNDGVNDARVLWDAVQFEWTMLYSGIRAGFGWSVGHATSPDLINWTEAVGNPIITANPATVQTWTSVAGNTVTVPDGSVFMEDAIVIARSVDTTESLGMSRIRRIIGNDLELYHEIAGLSGVDVNRSIATIGSGSITPHALMLETSGVYRLYITAFQPFILATGNFGDSEIVGSLTATNLAGPWTWDNLGSTNVPPNIWSADRAQENLAIVNAPVVRTVVDVAIRAVDVATPTTPEEGLLPTGLTTVCSGRDFLVEVWVMQVNGGTEGLVGGSLDMLFDPTTLAGVSIDHGTVFNDIPHADVIDNVGGRIDDFGGATLQFGKGVGNWALLARVQMSLTGTGPANLSLAPGAFAFALAGGSPPLPSGAVDLTETLALNLVPTDDGDPCTTDTCNGDGTVVHTPSFNAGTECCNPTDGTIMVIDDANVCTDDVCDAGTGNVTHTANVLACDDGNACTTSDTCAASVCVGGAAPNCDDSIACTTDTCDMVTGCVNTTVDAACDDTNACTTDTCSATLGCLSDGTGVTTTCDDGNACTTSDVCQGDMAGSCAGVDTSAVDCDDLITCTTDTCNPATGCVNTTVDAACDDTNACTADTCSATLGCVNDGTGITIACDDSDACTTVDVCQGDAVGTCTGMDTSATDCDDLIACTTDTCNPATGCVNTTVDAACDDANACTADTCDATLGCLSDGTGVLDACDDSDACTTGDVCQGDATGTCAGVDTSATDCNDGNACTSDTCDAMLGCMNDGTGITVACDDSNACTSGDICQGDATGTCIGVDTSATDCDDLIACTADTCNPATGCVNTTVDAACDDTNACTTDTCDATLGCLNDGTGVVDPCDDGNACTTGDTCQGDATGTCAGVDTSTADCDDAIACTLDSCDPIAGCINMTVDTACDDSIACTTDTCDAIIGCVNTTVDTACDDTNACTADTCSATLGCVNDGTGIIDACDDSNACTTSDACQGDAIGTCAGVDTSATDCDDMIACTTDTCDAVTGCVNTTVDAACDDANACTTDTCSATLGCLNDGTGVVIACDDSNACTTGDACQGDAVGTCAGVDTSAVDCDDMIACTTDTCDAITGCVNSTVDAVCDDTNACTTDTCDATLGCLNNGTGVVDPCDDGNACTTGDVCQGDAAGTCTGMDTSAVDCDDLIACTADSCDAIAGCINMTVDALCDDTNACTADTCDATLGCLNNGTGVVDPCDDGNACTTSDTCAGDATGTCTGVDTSATDCDDLIACTTDTCDSVTGCINTTVDAMCDDANVCTADTCDATLGCLNNGTGVSVTCDDSNGCTSGDVCQGDAIGTCMGMDTAAVDCDDNDLCTTDTCDVVLGCINTPVDVAVDCDDGNICTTELCIPATGCFNRNVIYDLDLNNNIDFADFALFAPHFGSFDGVSVNYLDCADFFWDGVIEAADVSFFATAIGKLCDDSSIAFTDAIHTPPLPCPIVSGGSTSAVADAVTVELRLAMLEARSPNAMGDSPPQTLRQSAVIGKSYFLEIWVRMFGTDPTGLTGGTVDLYLDPALLTIDSASVDPTFGLFARGEIDPVLGMVTTIGGGALSGGIAVDQWVRFATIELTAVSQGVSTLQVGIGDLGFAQFGVGAIPASDVMTPVQRATVDGKSMRSPGGIRSLPGR